jgi:hypothetical protein
MRSKPVWLLAAALLLVCALPGWADPKPVGEEFRVNQTATPRQLKPQVAFGPSGNSLVVWENQISGIMGRAYDRNGKPVTGEMLLVANKNLPTIPASGEVLVRKEPALVILPNSEFLVFWTEERDHLVLEQFYEQRDILDQDVYGQRFSAAGAPIGERFRVNATTDAFQRRPRAAIKQGGLVVIWESALALSERDSVSVHGRLLNRRGQPAGDEFRIDAASSPEIWSLSLAANSSGEFLVAWEGGDVLTPDVYARFYDRDGSPLGAEFIANPGTSGRQRRPAVLATRNGDFLVAWQSSTGTVTPGIKGQFYSPAGARIGSEFLISKPVAKIQIAPALALLPSGNIVVTWLDWADVWPIGAFAVVIDSSGRTLGNQVKISNEQLYPQYQSSVAANNFGDVLASWEGRLKRQQSITARLLKAD